MKNNIIKCFQKIKLLFQNNPIYSCIAITSIIVLIMGILAIGLIKTLLFLILVDGILIL